MVSAFHRCCFGALVWLVTVLVVHAEPLGLQLRVEAPDELQAAARRIEALDSGEFSLAYTLTGAEPYLQPIRVVLAAEDSQIARRVPSWVGGFAVADEGLLVLFPQRVRSYPDRNLRVLVHHEVTHLLVARASGFRPVPRWFNEGIATVAAREWGIEDRTRYALAVVGKGPRTTRELEVAFQADDSGRVARAYALSSAFLRFLRATYGADITARILSLVAGGMVFEEAFQQAAGVGLPVAEKAFFEDEAFWSTWVPFLTSSTALWMAITTLALLAIKRRRARSRAMHEHWERQEQAEQQALVQQVLEQQVLEQQVWARANDGVEHDGDNDDEDLDHPPPQDEEEDGGGWAVN